MKEVKGLLGSMAQRPSPRKYAPDYLNICWTKIFCFISLKIISANTADLLIKFLGIYAILVLVKILMASNFRHLVGFDNSMPSYFLIINFKMKKSIFFVYLIK